MNKYCNPLSDQATINEATHLAMDPEAKRVLPICRGNTCPNCDGKIIPGLDAVYCYACQKAYPTPEGVSTAWGWTDSNMKQLRKKYKKTNQTKKRNRASK